MTKVTVVLLLPSLAVDWISSTPLTERTAASTFCVICVSISVGAAPGWLIVTLTAGKSMSGELLTSIRLNDTSPASVKPMKKTMGTIGLRIDHADMLRKFMTLAGASYRFVGKTGRTLSPGLRKPPARITTRSLPVRPETTAIPWSVTVPVFTSRRSTLLSLFTT